MDELQSYNCLYCAILQQHAILQPRFSNIHIVILNEGVQRPMWRIQASPRKYMDCDWHFAQKRRRCIFRNSQTQYIATNSTFCVCLAWILRSKVQLSPSEWHRGWDFVIPLKMTAGVVSRTSTTSDIVLFSTPLNHHIEPQPHQILCWFRLRSTNGRTRITSNTQTVGQASLPVIADTQEENGRKSAHVYLVYSSSLFFGSTSSFSTYKLYIVILWIN